MTNQNVNHAAEIHDLHDAIQLKAFGFIQSHANAHLDRQQLISRTIAHLQEKFGWATELTLERITVRALAEHEARGQGCYIDLSESGAFHVAVRDPETRALRVFTVTDLMRLVRTPSGLTALPTPSKRAACAGQHL